MNIEKLKQVRELISRTNESNFNMSGFAKENVFGKRKVYRNRFLNSICGSVCCIAGHAVLSDPNYRAAAWFSVRQVNDPDATLLSFDRAFSQILDCTWLEASQISMPRSNDIQAAGLNDDWKNWKKKDAIEWLDYWISFYENKTLEKQNDE